MVDAISLASAGKVAPSTGGCVGGACSCGSCPTALNSTPQVAADGSSSHLEKAQKAQQAQQQQTIIAKKPSFIERIWDNFANGLSSFFDEGVIATTLKGGALIGAGVAGLSMLHRKVNGSSAAGSSKGMGIAGSLLFGGLALAGLNYVDDHVFDSQGKEVAVEAATGH